VNPEGLFPPIRPAGLTPKGLMTNIMAKDKEKEVEVVEAPKESDAKVAFRALIESYKKQNPAKAELKKAELEKKLAAIA
jgi:hypothetical protein